MTDETRGPSDGDNGGQNPERGRASSDDGLGDRRSGAIAGPTRDSATDGDRDKPKPLVRWPGTQRWIALTVPLVSCLALVLSSWEFVRESRNSVNARRAERIRGVQANMMALVELETEYLRAMESSSQAMVPYNLNATMQILLEATSEDVDDLMGHLNPSILIAFAYYNASAGNFGAAERYYLEVLRRLENQPMAANHTARRAATVGLGNVYLADSPVADKPRARELLESVATEYEEQPDMTNRSMLVELLGRWAFMEQSLGDPTIARELRGRAREALALLGPDDPRRPAHEEYLYGGSVYSPVSFLRNGEWHLEFPGDPGRRGVATIRRQATPMGRGWYIHAEVFAGSRLVEQWGGNGFVSETEVAIFSLQGYHRQSEFVAPIPVFGTVQLQPSAEDQDLLEGTYNLLGAVGAGIRLRREN